MAAGIKNYNILLLIALVLAAEGHGLSALQIGGADQFPIIDAPRKYGVSELSRDIGRTFEAPTPCLVRSSGATILQILGPNARAIHVHHYKKPAWPDMSVVREYLHRILGGLPEGGGTSSGVYWAEGRRVEILASVEFRSGQRTRMAFANGYAHFEDESGCEWWARYLGPDRSRWIVRE
jgi:hypothetical protein